jgi:serine/threonine protein kinase
MSSTKSGSVSARLPSGLIADVTAGQPGNVRSLLRQRRCPKKDASVVGLAFGEFLRRKAAGEMIDGEEFAARFPLVRSSLLKLIEIDALFGDRPRRISDGPDDTWPVPGETWLGLELLEELGRGMFARVYLAREPALGNRLVAVKVTPMDLGEAHVLGRLQHSHIVPVHSVKRDEELFLTAIVMPFLSRVSLLDVTDLVFCNGWPPVLAAPILDAVRWLNAYSGAQPDASPEKPWPRGWRYEDAMLYISIQLAGALKHAHRLGILHCDIKPSNVLVTSDGRALLFDFNVAAPEGETRWIGGTPAYMAPEQLRCFLSAETRKKDHIDPRTDVFSLGATLFELCHGRTPFEGAAATGDPRQFIESLLEEQKQGPARLASDSGRVDPSLDALIRRCLAFDPAGRLQSAEELSRRLAAELKPRRRFVRGLRSHRRATAGAAAVAFSAALAIVGWQFTRPPYGTRQLQAGQAAFAARNDSAAEEHLTRALKADPDSSEARFLRACARFRQEDLVGAYADFKLLSRDDPDGRATAGFAHVVAVLQENYGVAGLLYIAAIEKGCDSAVLQNNAGFCLLTQGRIDEAADYIRRACQLDPRLSAAHHNLALVEFRFAHRQKRMPAAGPIEKALELGPETAALTLDAAFFHAFCAKLSSSDPQARSRSFDKAFEFLSRAVDLGAGSSHLAGIATTNPALEGDPRWTALANRVRPDARFTRSELYLAPFPELARSPVSQAVAASGASER